jgi:hypothetical protein
VVTNLTSDDLIALLRLGAEARLIEIMDYGRNNVGHDEGNRMRDRWQAELARLQAEATS